jgi:hypothetical protein
MRIEGPFIGAHLAAYFLDPEEFPESLFVDAFEAMSPQ